MTDIELNVSPTRAQTHLPPVEQADTPEQPDHIHLEDDPDPISSDVTTTSSPAQPENNELPQQEEVDMQEATSPENMTLNDSGGKEASIEATGDDYPRSSDEQQQSPSEKIAPPQQNLQYSDERPLALRRSARSIRPPDKLTLQAVKKDPTGMVLQSLKNQ